MLHRQLLCYPIEIIEHSIPVMISLWAHAGLLHFVFMTNMNLAQSLLIETPKQIIIRLIGVFVLESLYDQYFKGKLQAHLTFFEDSTVNSILLRTVATNCLLLC